MLMLVAGFRNDCHKDLAVNYEPAHDSTSDVAFAAKCSKLVVGFDNCCHAGFVFSYELVT